MTFSVFVPRLRACGSVRTAVSDGVIERPGQCGQRQGGLSPPAPTPRLTPAAQDPSQGSYLFHLLPLFADFFTEVQS